MKKSGQTNTKKIKKSVRKLNYTEISTHFPLRNNQIDCFRTARKFRDLKSLSELRFRPIRFVMFSVYPVAQAK